MERYPNRELAVYALYLLNGASERQHTENIALKCFEIDASSFSWTKYPDYPDKDIVRVALTDAAKEQYGSYVEGRTGQGKGLSAKTKKTRKLDGWRLTAEGIEWVRENENELKKNTGAQAPKEHRQKLVKKINNVKRHPLYEKYEKASDQFSPDIGAIASLLKCRVDASESIWAKRFENYMGQAQSTQESEVLTFLKICQAAYFEQKL